MDIILILLLLFFIFLFLYYRTFNEYFTDGINYLEGIDKIYWINLERSKDRYVDMTKMFKDPIFNGISIERINAFDGKEKDATAFFTKPKGEIKITKLEYGCLLSHLQTIKAFSESNHEVALIMEDDATLEFKPYWKKTVKQIMDDAPLDWEIIQLSYITHIIPENEYTKIDNNSNYTIKYWSTCAYIIKKSAAKKIIDKTYLPYVNKYLTYDHIDCTADKYIYHVLNSYTYKYPLFIYKTQTESTIHNDDIKEHNETKKRLIQVLYPEYYKQTYL
jgi:GR25 family glycosyltransferase involved in LPS biosynthesis